VAGVARYTVEKNVERSLGRAHPDLREQHPSPTSHVHRLPLQTMPVATAASFVPSATTYGAPGPAPASSESFRPSRATARAQPELVSPRYQAKNSDIGAGGPRGADGSAADLQLEATSIGAINELSSAPGVAPAVHAPFLRKAKIIASDPSQPPLAVESIAPDLLSHTHDTSRCILRAIHGQISRQNSRPSVIPAQPEDQATDKRRLLESGVGLGSLSCRQVVHV
jgi:hypothetical protein